VKITQFKWRRNERLTHDLSTAEWSSPDLVFVFGSRPLLQDGSVKHDLRQHFERAALIGCSTSGEIVGDEVIDDSVIATGVTFDHTRLRTADAKITHTSEGVVRTVLSVSEQDKSMTFAGDIPQGGTAQLIKTNVNDLVDGATDAAEASLVGVGEKRPDLALLVSCVGRKLVMQQRVEEEIEAIRGVFGADTSIAGFYSYGELRPFS
jgi:hypothetical protein